MNKYEKVYSKLEKYGQEHLLSFFDSLTCEEQKMLLAQINTIDFELVNKLYNDAKNHHVEIQQDLKPMKAIKKEEMTEQEREKLKILGENVIKRNEYAVVTMAGGQGTRLGHAGPKGTFILDNVNNKSLFEIFADKLKEAHQQYATWINWYIMTSRENNSATMEFFKKNKYFGYPIDKIVFFIQGELPMVLEDGKIAMENKYTLKLAADGHGGVIEAIYKSHILEDMKSKNIKWVFMGAVDNCLLKLVDVIFLGLSEDKQTLASAKTLAKLYPEEKIGVFCTSQNVPCVIEYTELPQEMMNLKDESGELMYSESHVMMNMLSMKALEQLRDSKLPYHVAHKKTDYIDENGEVVVANEPNAYKFESFIFDTYKVIGQVLLYRGERENEFAPLKNKEGIDSIETARKLYYKYVTNEKGKIYV